MAGACCHHAPPTANPGLRRALWVALAINVAMFAVEGAAGLMGGSVALQADALDFLGDSANYAISLAVLGLSLRARAGAALLKGASMGIFGIAVLAQTIWAAIHPELPSAATMGAIGILALAANIAAAALLFRHRQGDSNTRSVWLCTRNDAIGNVAVVIAASGVLASGAGWPDLVVGGGMALLALSAAWSVLRQATAEWRHGGDRHAPSPA